jgi:hypothetical protein
MRSKKPPKKVNLSPSPSLSPAASKWYGEVYSYLERRIALADQREDDIEIRYLETCMTGLMMLEQLGVDLESMKE